MEWFDNWRKRRNESRRKRLEEASMDMFQITEYNHLLWFTYNGGLFAPCHLLGCKSANDAVALVETLRGMYVERNI